MVFVLAPIRWQGACRRRNARLYGFADAAVWSVFFSGGQLGWRSWQSYYDTDKDEFQYSVLHKDDNFKLILIYWNGKSKSKKHGHMKGGGLMRILSGEVIETRFASDEDCSLFAIIHEKTLVNNPVEGFTTPRV